MQQSSSGNNQDFIRQITTLGAIVGAFFIKINKIQYFPTQRTQYRSNFQHII
jgi:hypothetical protein